MGKKFLFLLILFLASGAAAEVQYSIDADKEKTSINTTVQLECSDRCPVSNWRLDWQIPEGVKIKSIEDSEGQITDYDRQGGQVAITTNRGTPKRSELLRINMVLDEEAENIHEGWYRRKISLPGFNDETLSGRAVSDDLISGWIGYGFDSSYGEKEMRFTGKGPTNLRLNFGKGNQTRYYQFFGELPQQPDEAYKIAIGTIGQVQSFKRFPAAVLPGEKYNRTVNSWSSGEYVAGSIRLREGLGDDFLPVLAHETVHGVNERKLKWDGTRSSYFDEGTSEYAEFLMKKKLYREGKTDIGPRELFGAEKRYVSEQNGKRYIYTVGSKGSKERLWEYYNSESDYMKEWNPSDNPGVRDFGYAYSELVIRNHILRNNSLSSVYRNMSFDSPIEDSDEKWSFYAKNMDMDPCNYESRERFDRCLERINNYNYPVYSAEPTKVENQIQIKKLSIEEREPATQRRLSFDSAALLAESVLSSLWGFLKNLLQKV